MTEAPIQVADMTPEDWKQATLEASVHHLAKDRKAAAALLEGFRIRDNEIGELTRQLVDERNRTDELRTALGIDLFPADTVHDRMMDFCEHMADTLADMERQQVEVTNTLYGQNQELRLALAFWTQPRPWWHRVMNVFFPIHTNKQGPAK